MRVPVRTLSLVALAAVAAGAGCKQRVDADASAVKHDFGAAVFGAERWQWDEESLAEYQKVIMPYNAVTARLLPPTDPLTVRMQNMLTAFHQAITNPTKPSTTKRGKVLQAALKVVPAPVARVIVDPEKNAFVPAAPICFSQPVRFPGAAPAGAAPIERVKVDQFGTVFATDSANCLERNVDAKVVKAFLDWFNANQKVSGCTLDSRGGVIQVGDKCKFDPSLTGRSASGVLFESTSNNITIQTGIIAGYESEAELAFIIAHELGHYYRAHIVSTADHFDYFYKGSDTNEANRPKRGGPDLDGLGRRAVAASNAFWSSLLDFTFSDAKIGPDAYPLLGRFMDGRDPICPEAAKLRERFEKALTTSFPVEKPNDAANNQYFIYEKAALDCLKKVTIVQGPTTDPAKIDFALVEDALTSVLALGYHAGDAMPGLFKSLYDVVDKSDRQVKANIKHADDVMKEADAAKLGFYTYEQEADEFMTEFGWRVGLNPEVGVDASITLGAGGDDDAKSDPTSLSVNQCRKIRQGDAGGPWRVKGKRPWIPIGDYADEHHSFCFRAYNIFLEIEAHAKELVDPDYKTLPREIAFAGAEQPNDWQALRALAEKAQEQPVQKRRRKPKRTASGLVEHGHFEHCPVNQPAIELPAAKYGQAPGATDAPAPDLQR
jgi:hypothetical protein